MTAPPRLAVHSYEELMRHQPAILRRISDMPNGGNLFMIHPLRLLADIGVTLTPELEAQLIRRFPELSGLSSVPYDALKSAKGEQKVRFNVRGLFRKKTR
jgi:hypothetical protein